MSIHRFFLSAPRGIVEILADEVQTLGAKRVRVEAGGVAVRGPLQFGYRLCLWSRCANRVLLMLGEHVIDGPEALYEAARSVPWEEHLSPTQTFAVEFLGRAPDINHPHFGALRIKDAVVDRLREQRGERPSVDRHTPDMRIVAYARGRSVEFSLDLSGESLHRRGYRIEGSEASLKENLAAAMLMKGGWPELAASGGGFLDPMCGAGTLAIEAAMMACDVAPGLHRPFLFWNWLGHDAAAWQECLTEAKERESVGLSRPHGPIIACDIVPHLRDKALRNVARAGLDGHVQVETRTLQALPPAPVPTGLVAVNPPYGERLGTLAEAQRLHGTLGTVLRERYGAWRGVLITSEDELVGAFGGRPATSMPVDNGPIEARFVVYDPLQGAKIQSAFADRLRKNLQKRNKWAQKAGVTCYRVYDADIPEYNVAIDLYEKAAVVFEYKAPKTIDPAKAAARRAEVLDALPEVLGIPPHDISFKMRQRQRGTSQYEKHADEQQFETVHEGGHKFTVNLHDYLDTGLFLDHRSTRALIAELAPGRRFLNLFCYTGTVTVYAAKAGATSTTSVDLSATYLDWMKRNLELNGIRVDGERHRIFRADARVFMEREQEQYDLIFIDPPTFSNSKAMDGTWDVQRDHVEMLEAAMRCLADGGVCVFSTNLRGFKLDEGIVERYRVTDISRQTIPPDFERSPNIHRCFKIERGASSPPPGGRR